MIKKGNKDTLKFLEPLSILLKYKTSETPKIDNIFIYLRFDYISVIIRINQLGYISKAVFI
jgi:hypothetical protein